MTPTCIMLAGGTLFDILDPEGSDFTIGDIAHGLGRVCRFAGQTNRFYSVAEHSCHVARLVPVDLARAAMLHDATEAFIGDVTRPLKALLPEYRRIEDRIADAIARRFLPGSDLPDPPRKVFSHPDIKAADLAILVIEARHLMPERDGYWISVKTDVKARHPDVWQQAKRVRLECDRPEFATAAWLRAWHRYGHWQARDEQDRLESEAA